MSLWLSILLACTTPHKDDPEHPRDSDPGQDTDAGDDTDEPASRAGTYQVAIREQLVASGSVRTTAVTWEPAAGRWVAAWGAVEDAFRIHAAVLDWTEGAPALTVSPPTRLDDGAYNAFEPDLAAAGDGTLLVVYEDDRVGAGNGAREVYGQRLRLAGDTLEQIGPDFTISAYDPVEQYTPAVAWESGTWFVAYSDDRDNTGGDQRRLWGRTVSPDGQLGPEQRLGGDALWQVLPSVAGSDGEGRFLVVWGDYEPLDGGLDCGYRARLLDASGAPIGTPIDLARIGQTAYDRPAVAWNPWARAWLVAWTSPQRVLGSWVGLDGTLLDSGFELAAPTEGAGAPYLAYLPTTHSFALTYHAWTSNDGFLQELNDEGVPVGEPVSVSEATPPLGTFYVPLAASDVASRVLVVPSLDWTRVTGTLFVGP